MADPTNETPVTGNQDKAKIETPPGWRETKKELELNGVGEYIVKTVTLEKKPKKYLFWDRDDFDFLLRGITIFAIFIPIALFYLQQRNERARRTAESKSSIYSTITTKVHILADKEKIDSIDDAIIDAIKYQDLPKFKLVSSKSESESLKAVILSLKYYSQLLKITSVSRDIDRSSSMFIFYLKDFIESKAKATELKDKAKEIEDHYFEFNDIAYDLRLSGRWLIDTTNDFRLITDNYKFLIPNVKKVSNIVTQNLGYSLDFTAVRNVKKLNINKMNFYRSMFKIDQQGEISRSLDSNLQVYKVAQSSLINRFDSTVSASFNQFYNN